MVAAGWCVILDHLPAASAGLIIDNVYQTGSLALDRQKINIIYF